MRKLCNYYDIYLYNKMPYLCILGQLLLSEYGPDGEIGASMRYRWAALFHGNRIAAGTLTGHRDICLGGNQVSTPVK